MIFVITEKEELSGDGAKLYSVTLDGDETTLLEQFFEKNAEYETEIKELLNKLYLMEQETGCQCFFNTMRGNLVMVSRY